MWIRVAECEAFERSGGLKRVTHGEGEVLVLLHRDGIAAIANECPHQGAPLTAGYQRDGWIECPLHAWRFDLTTGKRIGHLRDRIAVYPTRINDGLIEVELPD